MILDQLYNFDFLKREASSFRQNLRHTKGSTRNEIESFLFSKASNINKYSFFNLKRTKPISSNDFVRNINNFKYVMYVLLKENTAIENLLEVFKNKSSSFLKRADKEIIILEDQIKEIDLQLNSKYSNVKSFSVFQEKDFEETYDLIDLKTNLRLEKKYQCSYKDGVIKIPSIASLEILPSKIEILNEKSFNSDALISLNKETNTSFIWREEKFFSYIVGKKENHDYGEQIKNREVQLQFVCSFNTVSKLNNLNITMCSALPVNIKEIYYWDNEWLLIENLGIKETYKEKKIWFETLETKKIKIVLEQRKYIELCKKESLTNKENIINSFSKYLSYVNEEEILKIYDFSIQSLSFKYEAYNKVGFYREANEIQVNNPLTFSIKENLLLNTEKCFVEKEAHVVLYGDENRSAFKQGTKSSLRVNSIIKIPNSNKIQTEVLIPIKNEAKLSFFPKIKKDSLNEELHNVISVQLNNVELTMYQDFLVSIDEGNTWINQAIRIGELEKQIKEKIAGSVYIQFIKSLNPEDLITCTYKIDNFFYLNEEKNIFFSNLEVGFEKSLNKSSGFIRPRFILRNFNFDNASDMISNYVALIEELKEDSESYIEYETYKEKAAENNINGL
jgi:hypothetical protein